jgi:hypothetical protein
LPANARFSAIKGQIKGGGAGNPHGTTTAIAKRYLSGNLKIRAALKEARRVADRGQRHEVRYHLKNLARMVPYPSGVAKPLPHPSKRKGPEGVVEFKVSAQLFLEDYEDRYIGFWPNKIELDYRNARLYAQLMRESASTSDEKRTLFIIYDLRRCREFSFEVDELDKDFGDLNEFFAKIEGDVKRAKLH